MKIRPCKDSDFSKIAKLLHKAFIPAMKDMRFTFQLHEAKDVLKIYQEACKDLLLVVEEKKQPVAFVATATNLFSFWFSFPAHFLRWHKDFFKGKHTKNPFYLFNVARIRMMFFIPLRLKFYFTGPFMLLMAVDKSMQKKGLAKKLVNKTIAKLKQKGYTKVTAQIREDNVPCIKVFEKLKFKKIKRIYFGPYKIGIFRKYF